MSRGNSEFAAAMRGDDADSKSFRRFVLMRLRAARLLARSLVKEIDSIGIALHSNFIDAETAVRWMAELDALELLYDNRGDVEDVRAGSPTQAEVCTEGISLPVEGVSEVGGGGQDDASRR